MVELEKFDDCLDGGMRVVKSFRLILGYWFLDVIIKYLKYRERSRCLEEVVMLKDSEFSYNMLSLKVCGIVKVWDVL